MFPPAVNSQVEVQKEPRILTQASAQAKHREVAELRGREPRRRKAPGAVVLGPAQPGGLAKASLGGSEFLQLLQRTDFHGDARRLGLEHGLFSSKWIDTFARLLRGLADGSDFQHARQSEFTH